VAYLAQQARRPSHSESRECKCRLKKKCIHSVFILRPSGCPVWYRIYHKENHIDPLILSGFFTAMNTFAREVAGGGIKSMEAGNIRFTFHHLKRGLLVVCSRRETPLIVINRTVIRISILLMTEYPRIIEDNHPVTSFSPNLGEQIERIVEESSILG